MAHRINLARTPASLQAPAYEMWETVKALRAMVAEAVDAAPACSPSSLPFTMEEDVDDASFETLSLADMLQEEGK